MSTYKKIAVTAEHEGQVLSITLNSPKGNVLDAEMMNEIIAAVVTEGKSPNIKALLFRGEGKHFSFGASVEEHKKESAREMLKTFHSLFRTLIHSTKPMIAVVQGQCLGGAMELAAFCHWIFAGDDAVFGQPEIVLGVFPPVASLLLPYKIGQGAADDISLTGRSVKALDAQRLGLVNFISVDPDTAANAFLVEHILPKSAIALSFATKASRWEMYESFEKKIDDLEKMYVEELMETKDANEGIASFLEKRKPTWRNE